MMRFVWLCSAVLVLAGCGENAVPKNAVVHYTEAARARRSADGRVPASAKSEIPDGSNNSVAFGESRSPAEIDGDARGDALGKQLAQADAGKAAPDAPAVERKIVYEAKVSLVVEDFAKTQKRVSELVSQFKGYITSSDVDRTQGEYRKGRWVVRIPVDQFQPFLDAAGELGVPETLETNAQDVTEEFVDLEARITNKREVERRLIKLLEERTGNIKDVITVEQELGRVREEIERMEGRLRYLTNVSALTTVRISAREEQDYQPPQAPTFTAQVRTTWGNSLGTITTTGKSLALAGVAVTPWLPVAAVVLLPSAWLVRRRFGRRAPR